MSNRIITEILEVIKSYHLSFYLILPLLISCAPVSYPRRLSGEAGGSISQPPVHESYKAVLKTEKDFRIPKASKVLYKSKPLKTDTPFYSYSMMFETKASAEEIVIFYKEFMKNKECIVTEEVIENKYHTFSLKYSCNQGYESDFSIQGQDQSYSSSEDKRIVTAGFSLPLKSK